MSRPALLHAEMLESRETPSTVQLNANEQLTLELINRARVNPSAEAARYSIDLNEGLNPGTISSSPKQPLAAEQALLNASAAHAQDMLTRGYFSHINPEGKTPWNRADQAGYKGFAGAENLVSNFASNSSQIPATVANLHEMLFVDRGVAGRGHRVSMLKDNFQEVGPAIKTGAAEADGFINVMGAGLFGTSSKPYITGVVYTDGITGDRFYTIGEGVGGVTISAVSDAGATYTTTSSGAGGYQLAVPSGNYTMTAILANGAVQSLGRVTVGSQNVKVDVIPSAAPPAPPAPPSPNPTAIRTVVAAGSGRGSPAQVKFVDPANGSVQGQWAPYEASFIGGVRTATADVTGDGIEDVIVGPGPGRAPTVKIFDRVTGSVIREIAAFESSFTGGVYVTAADINNDGRADVIITPDEGGGPRVRVLSGTDNSTLADFFGIDDQKFRGGARASTGDMNADGRPDVIVAAGFMGGPRVAAFDGRSVAANRPTKLFNDFFAFEQSLRNGIFVSVGDLNGDGFGELIAGGGPGGGPRVIAFNGRSMLNNNQERIADFFVGSTSDRGGVRLAVDDADRDGITDLVAGSGSGSGSRVTVIKASAVRGTSTPATTVMVDAFPGSAAGVFVG
ncbi:MAG: FG-GAP-like repeat-containing protein [Gemmataceae bacterium]